MLAVVTIDSGMEFGRRMWLRHNEIVRVGRGFRADFPVSGDHRLADIHFTLQAAHDACWLRIADHGAAVWINGQQVHEGQVLAHDDLIVAGGTRFRVMIEGTRGGPSPQIQAIRYRAERCASDWPRFVGDVQDHTLLDIARLAANHHQLHLVVNLRNAREPVPHTLGADSDLLRHLNDRPLARKQLILISPPDGVDLLQRLQTLLGKDAVCCLFTDKPKRALADALRPVVISYSAPSILDAQLATCPAGFVRGILMPVSLVVVEAQDGRQWHAYPNPDQVPTWKELGFPNPPLGTDAGSRLPNRIGTPD